MNTEMGGGQVYRVLEWRTAQQRRVHHEVGGCSSGKRSADLLFLLQAEGQLKTPGLHGGADRPTC